MFSSRVITIGTLIAVFLATSDELIPIMISYPQRTGELIIILTLKLVIAIIAGTIIDVIINKRKKTKTQFDKDSMHEHIHDMCKHCDCEHGILKSSIRHTLSIFFFLLVITFIINIIVEYIGDENFRKIILSG